MPEMIFHIQWPDGAAEACYSPSTVIKDYFAPGETYALQDFLERSRTALTLASDRVQARYGVPCSRALGQLARIETAGRRFVATPDARIAVTSFNE